MINNHIHSNLTKSKRESIKKLKKMLKMRKVKNNKRLNKGKGNRKVKIFMKIRIDCLDLLIIKLYQLCQLQMIILICKICWPFWGSRSLLLLPKLKLNAQIYSNRILSMASLLKILMCFCLEGEMFLEECSKIT